MKQLLAQSPIWRGGPCRATTSLAAALLSCEPAGPPGWWVTRMENNQSILGRAGPVALGAAWHFLLLWKSVEAKSLQEQLKAQGKDCDRGWGWGDGGESLIILSQLLSNWASGGRDPVPGAPHPGARRCEEARTQDEASSHLPCKATPSQDHRSLPLSLFQHHRSWALKMGGS